MSFSFDPEDGLIIVPTEVEGPAGSAVLRLALDTGATSTLINASLLVAVGCDLALVLDRVEMTTGSGIEFTPRIIVAKIVALGHSRRNFPVLGHTLPPSAGVDGLLGLDFLRNHALTIDFRNGWISIG